MESSNNRYARHMYILLGIIGAIAGGVVGYFIFRALLKVGLYAMVLPGALVGIGCGLLSRRRSFPLGFVSAALGLAAGLVTRWIANAGSPTFMEFIREGLTPVTFVMIFLGAVLAFWFGLGRGRPGRLPERVDAEPNDE